MTCVSLIIFVESGDMYTHTLAQRTHTKKRTSFDLIIHQRLKLFWTLFVTVYSTLDFANFRTFANYMCGKSFLYSNFEAIMFICCCHQQWREKILNSCCKVRERSCTGSLHSLPSMSYMTATFIDAAYLFKIHTKEGRLYTS